MRIETDWVKWRSKKNDISIGTWDEIKRKY